MNFEWHIEKREVSSLKEWGKNPRKLMTKGLEDLTNSINKFGLAEPIVINTDGTICGGHGRKKVLTLAKIKECDCYVPDRELTEDEFRELNIRLNANIAGEFDWEVLANEWDVDQLNDYGLDTPGFDVNSDEMGTDFTLPDGDKAPFQQMTFTLADEQAEQIKNAINNIKQTDEYKYAETMGNENSNGNALYLIIMQWAEQKK